MRAVLRAALVLLAFSSAWPAGSALAAGMAPVRASDAAIDDLLGRPVGRVTVTVGGAPAAAPELLAVIDTRPGRPLAMADVRESLLHLMALQRFDDVRVRASAAGPGVDLVYDCVPRRLVKDIVFRGDLGLSESVLRRAVIDRYGPSPSPGRAEDIAAMLDGYYRDRGYLRAHVTPEIAQAPRPTESALVLAVQAGPRARYQRLALEGDLGLAAPTVFARLGLRPGDPYDPSALAQAIAAFVDGLRSKGYYEAQLSAVPRITENDQAVVLTLTGERGPHVTIEFRGSPLPRSAKADFLSAKREGSVDEDLLEDAGSRIQQYLQGQGYAQARAPHTREQRGAEVLITFDVDRGPFFRIRRIGAAEQSPALRAELGLQAGDPFVASKLSTYIAVLAQSYREQGYDAVKVEAPTTQSKAPNGEILVDVDLLVTPGVQKQVGSVAFEFDRAGGGTDGAGGGAAERELRRLIEPTEGQPFYEPRIKARADEITRYYLNRGYEDAAVDWSAVPQGPSRVDVRFRVHPGPRFLVDRILITGNVHTNARTIEREVTLKPGAPLDFDQIYESQQRLSALGLFRKVQVTPLQRGQGDRRDVLVAVEEAPATTIGYGAGLEGGQRLRGEVDANGNAIESLDISPSGSFEIGRRNLWGKNRSLTFFSRIGIKKHDTVTEADTTTATSPNGFREYRIVGSFREPRAFGTRADLVLSAYGEQAARSAFNFNRRAARAELSFRLSSHVSTNVRYELEETRLFDQRIAPADRPTVDRAFPQVRLGGFSSSFLRSTRDDELNPSSGTLFSLDGKIAAQALGGEVGFAKTYAQFFWFHRLPGPRRVVFASGIRVGLARGFPRYAPARDADDNVILGPDGQPVIVRVEDLPASERFFAGGDTTVRGFGQDRLGAPETLTATGVPKGGQAVIILNGELRVPLASKIEGVTFLDLGNVFDRVSAMDPSALRPGAGFGIRFNSPIGPIRADVGFKLDRRPFANGTSESPVQFYIGVGHAF